VHEGGSCFGFHSPMGPSNRITLGLGMGGLLPLLACDRTVAYNQNSSPDRG
jgi:hypothetical protein